MNKLLEFLDVRKSYLGALVIFVAGGLNALKLIDDATFKALFAVGGAVSVVGLRAAIKKLE